jgi:SRF-type transcription factor (DNA-binding and dimerisation domain)
MTRRKSKRRIAANEAEERRKMIVKQRKRRTGLASKINQYVELCDHDALVLLRNRETQQFYTYISINDTWPPSIKKSIKEIVSPPRHPLI